MKRKRVAKGSYKGFVFWKPLEIELNSRILC